MDTIRNNDNRLVCIKRRRIKMTEKLKTINPYDEPEIDMDIGSVGNLVYENTPLIQKLNELVDAVNNQQIQLNNHECRLLDLHSRITALEDPTYHEEPADPYAEPRKWIGYLCWFWNENYEDGVIGILTGVFDNADRPFERNIDQTLYKHCEPVKPDSELIYHGE